MSAPKHVDELDTPAVTVDLDVMESNISRMAEYAREKKLSLRPHAKTHKTPAIAALQIRAGAVGVTVAKIGEAERMAAAGIDDILVAYPVLGATKIDRLVKLARECRMTVSLDDMAAAEAISGAARRSGVTVSVLADLDVGLGRTGVQTVDALVSLAAGITKLPALPFEGIFCYPGHIEDPPATQGPALARVESLLAEGVDWLIRSGIPVNVVSSGSTPTARRTHLCPHVTEFRPGTYAFNDFGYHAIGASELRECALTVASTVVSTAHPGQVVIDAGSKTLSSDTCPRDARPGFGYVVEYPEAVITHLNEEHGLVDVRLCPARPKIGERVTVIPNHVCVVVNLHDRLYGIRKGAVEVVWPVAARGLVQ